ncbi:MAG: TonB-dependent receptor [Hyphomonadaceae bacterium]
MTHFNRYSLVSLMALSLAMPVVAQEAGAQQNVAPAPQREREVVVVTAQKREETVQDIAVAITAVTAQQRDELGVNSITDLTNVTPGLQYTAGNERVTLRGIGRNTNNFGAEPGVANYTDGIYQSFASIAGRDNIFVDRIEVLRGPQGTLYGRNSVGGALNIISKRPTDDFHAEFVAGIGNFESTKIGASFSGPINDSLRYRVVGFKEARDKGIFTNVATGETEGYNVDNYNWEIQLEGDIGDRFSWWTKYTTGGYHNAGPPGGRTTGESFDRPYDITFGSLLGTGAVTPTPTWAYSNDPAIIGYTQTGSVTQNPGLIDPWAVNQSQSRFADLDGYNDFALEAIYSFDTFDVKYLGGYIYYNYNLTDDQDSTPITSITYNSLANGAPVAVGTPGSSTRTIFPEQTLLYTENRAFFSNEVNFVSTTDGPLQWIGGIYAYQENFKQPTSTYFKNEPLADLPMLLDANYLPSNAASPYYLAAPNPDRLLSYSNNIGLNNSYGIYGQVDWQFTDTLKSTVGLRYSVDNKHIQEEARLFCYIQCSFTPAYLPYTDVTQAIWNGSSPNDVNGPQPGVASATDANPSGVVYDPTTGLAKRLLEDEWNAVTGTAGLEWTPNDDTLVFAKYTRGYKTGGFNANSMAPLPRTNNESVNSYELGWKQEIPAWYLTANMSAFYYDYQDVQVPLGVIPTSGPAYTAFVNIPKVETTGFELETQWNPIADLNFMLTYAYVNPEIKEADLYNNPLITTDDATGTSVEGNILPNAAKNKIAFNTSYKFNLPDGSTLMPSLNYYWRDKFTSSVFNDADTYTPEYDQTDARLIWNDAGGQYTVIGWVKNVFDQEGYDSASASRRRSDGVVYHTYTPTLPRTYGVEFQFHW